MSQVKRFFQVVLADALQLGKLEIPAMFVHRHGQECLSVESVLLVAPTGDTWRMGLEIGADRTVMLGDGWAEFARHYSIRAGYFVIFRFKHTRQSSAVFDVTILNHPTKMEIPYPRKPHVENVQYLRRNVRGPFFEKSVPAHNVHLCVPSKFIEEAELQDTTILVLVGHTGKRFDVKLNHTVTRDKSKAGVPKEYIKYLFGAGWSNFQRDNGMEVGEKLFFEYVTRSSLITVKKI